MRWSQTRFLHLPLDCCVESLFEGYGVLRALRKGGVEVELVVALMEVDG